jgi:cobalt/nickel transport system permease protein
MHIAEGVLSAPVLITGAAVAAAGVAAGLRHLSEERLMLAGLLGAAFFVASLVHVPVGLGSAHLIMNGILGVFLGWAAFPVLFVALLLQAVIFQFGGLTILGVNTATMGLGAVLAGMLYRRMVKKDSDNRRVALAGFLCGFCAVLFAGVFTALALAGTNQGFEAAALAIFVANIPIMVVEGFVTSALVLYTKRVKPEIFRLTEVQSEK